MIDKRTLIKLLQRDRPAGDLVFAILLFALAVFLVCHLGDQATWVKRTKFFAQPAFWPSVSLIGMLLFALLHLVGALVSKPVPGRSAELLLWFASIEYAGWFLIYVWLTPIIGYIGSTLLFTLLLTYRSGYRSYGYFFKAAIAGILVVVVFKSLMQVKIPAGQIYEYFPDAWRNFMLLYL